MVEQQPINPEIDTTRFVNIYEKQFVFHVGGQPRVVESKEEKIMPMYVAQLGAKHLVDKILQEKYKVADTLADSEIRRSLFASILPEMAEQRNIKPLSDDDFQKEVQAQLKKQQELIETMLGQNKTKDETIETLQKQIDELSAKLTKTKNISQSTADKHESTPGSTAGASKK